MTGRCRASLVALLFGLGVSAALATPICRWRDEQGRLQVSEIVPPRYRAQATCTDSRQYELSPEQARAARQQADDERARADAQAARAPPTRPVVPASPPAAGASSPLAKRPSAVITDTTDCATRWRLYDESVDCLGPYRTTRGAVKAEGYAVCNVVPRPEATCGPRRD